MLRAMDRAMQRMTGCGVDAVVEAGRSIDRTMSEVR
jgi:hypothetical protein